MSHQFKLGDLAIIISDDPEYRENIGQCVEVVEFADDEYPIRVIGDRLVCAAYGGGLEPLAHLWVAPSQLMPLRGVGVALSADRCEA